MGAIDSVASISEVGPISVAATDVSQAPGGPSGMIQGTDLGALLASPEGQKFYAFMQDSIQMNIERDAKRHHKHLMEAMKEARQNRNS